MQGWEGGGGRGGGERVQAHCFESSQIRCHNKGKSTKLRSDKGEWGVGDESVERDRVMSDKGRMSRE